MKLRPFALLAMAACAVASHAQSAFFTINDGTNTFLAISDLVLSRIHPTSEVEIDNYRLYRPGRPVYGHITFKMSLDATGALDDWMNSCFRGETRWKGVSIYVQDAEGGNRQRFNHNPCELTAVMFPGCDGSSKDPAYLAVELQGPKITTSTFDTKINPKVQKKWLPANFRLSISGLEASCKNVSKIEAITVKQVADFIGGDLDGDGLPDFACSDLVFTLPTQDAQAFNAWFLDGTRSKDAQIDYLDTDGSTIHSLRMSCAIREITFDPGLGRTDIRCSCAHLRTMGPGK